MTTKEKRTPLEVLTKGWGPDIPLTQEHQNSLTMDMLMEGYEQIQKLEDKVELLEMDVWRLGQQIMDIETTKEKFYRGEVVERAKLDAYFKKWYEEATIEKIENE